MAPLMSFFERIKTAATAKQAKREKKTADGGSQASDIFLKSKISIGRFKRHSKIPDLESKRYTMSDMLGYPVQKVGGRVSHLGETKVLQEQEEQEPQGPEPAEPQVEIRPLRRSTSVKRIWRRHSSKPSVSTHKDYVGPNYFNQHWGLDESENMHFVTAERSARLCRNSRRRSERAEIIDPFMKAPHDQEGSTLPASSFFALPAEEDLYLFSLSRSQSLISTR